MRIRKVLFLLLVTGAFPAFSQTAISGTVSDASATPLQGAVIITPDIPRLGVLSQEDGSFLLQTDNGTITTISISMLGYESQTIALNGRTQVDVTLAEKTTSLDEVVISAVGIEKAKQAIGYSVQSVSSDELTQSREANLVNALNGKVAGVEVVSTSGSPGASANIVIRGRTSINNNSPLFVVDGVPISNEYAGSNFTDQSNRVIDLNPDDIESLTVLKGAAATALYGVRAANGVILITTKKGKAGKTTVNFRQSVVADQVNKLPLQQQRYAQGISQGGIPVYRGPLESNRSWGPAIDTLRYDGSATNPFSPLGNIVGQSDPAATAVPVLPFDNPGSVFRTGITSSTHLSVSGGEQSTRFYLSAGLHNQTGVIPNSDWQRISLKASGQTNIGDKISVSSSVNYLQSGGNRMQRGSNLSGVMLGLMRTPVTFDLSNGASDPVNNETAWQFEDGTPRRYWSAYDNPFWSVNKNRVRDRVNRIIGQTQIDYQILPQLKLMYRIGTDFYLEERKSYWDNQSNEFGTGVIFDDLFSYQSINSDLLLSFDQSLGNDFSLKAGLGHNFFSERSLNDITEGETFILPDFYDISNVAMVTFADDALRRRQITGTFYDLMLSYKTYLNLNITGRWDWSSTLPTTEVPFFYDSYNLGFVFTEPMGLSTNKTFSYGKLRASFATVGGDASPYSLNTFYALQAPIRGQTSFLLQSTIGNAALRPEQTESIEAGLDLRFFRNRIGLDLTLYRSLSRDQIIQVPIAYASGYSFQIANAGEIRNIGVEALLTVTPVQAENLQWDVTVNFSANENTVLSLAEGVGDISFPGAGVTSTSNRAIPGQPYGVLYGTRWLRNDAGKILVDDDGYPLFDPQDPGIIGDPNPDWIAGLRNSLSWRGLYLSVLADVRKGGEIFNGTVGVMKNLGIHRSTESREEEVIIDGVKESDGSVNTTAIRLDATYYGKYPFSGVSEASVEDGSWIRIREVTLNYRLPAAVTERLRMNSLELGLSIRNAFLWTNYSGVDPETNLSGASNSFGREWFNSPNTRSLGLTLTTNF